MNTDLNPDLTEILDLCLRQMQQGKTIQDCAAQYPQYPQVLNLLRTATAVQNDEASTMPLQQADQLEQRLLRQFQNQQNVLAKGRTRSVLRLNRSVALRGLLVACAVVVIFFTGVGLTSVSANALPGDNLYGLKRLIEQFDLQFSISDGLRNQAYAHNADQRLYEATLLTLQNKLLDVTFITDTLNTLDVAKHYNLSADVQTLLAQQSGYLSALIKQKPSQTTDMNQFAVKLDRFVAASGSIVPDITATFEPGATPTPDMGLAPTGTSTPRATLTADDSNTDAATGQHTPNAKPVHPTQKPLPTHAKPNGTNPNNNGSNGNGGNGGNGKGH